MSTLQLATVDPNFQFARREESAVLPTVAEADSVAKVNSEPVPTLTSPWWLDDLFSHRSSEVADGQRWQLDDLIWLSIKHSPYVQSILIDPQIQDARALETLGEFDPATFVESIFNDTSDPVGNTLITGTANRLNEHLWENRSGVRGKGMRGGEGEFYQEFLFKDNNSDFFSPRNQADTTMVLRYTQPLMRGAGLAYNRSSYVVATLSASQTRQEAERKLQSHTLTITNAYWNLFAARAQYKQVTRGMQNLVRMREQLAQRSDIDSLRSQLLRADQALATQRANLAAANSQIVAAEAELRAAVAAPQLLGDRRKPILPETIPADFRAVISLQTELGAALNDHPEIQQVREALKSSRVRLQVAEQELRPTLDLVLESYVRGLNGNFDAAKSFGDQFSTGAPSYSAGLSYSRPYRGKAAKGVLQERRLELRRELLQLEQTLLDVGAKVESAVAAVDAAFVALESAVQATLTNLHELEYLKARYENSFLDPTSTSILIDQRLAAEIRLIESENEWVRAQVDHMIAIANLRYETGAILRAFGS